MGRFRGCLVGLALGLGLVLGVAGAPAQTIDRALSAEDSERVFGEIGARSGARLYDGLCERAKDFVAQKGKNEDPLLKNFRTASGALVVQAILEFCASGRFVLRGGEVGEDGKCRRLAALQPLHNDLIGRLAAIRPTGIDLVALICVSSQQKIALWNLHANGLLIENSEIAALDVTGGGFTYGVAISGTTVTGGVAIEGTTIGTSLEVSGSRIGAADAASPAFGVSASVARSLLLHNSTFTGTVAVTGNEVRGDLQIVGSRITGNLALSSNTVGGELLVGAKTTVGGRLALFDTRAKTLRLRDIDVADDVDAVAMKVEETVYIGADAQPHTGAVRTYNATFRRNVDLRNLKADRLRIANVEFGADLLLTSATVGNVYIFGSTAAGMIHSGNARLKSLELRATSVPTFDCSDCEVSQYILLAGRFSQTVNVSGAQIRARLLFRDGDDAASWIGTPWIDLRDIQVETIVADYCDLLVTVAGGKVCDGPVVPAVITGAKFQNIVAGRSADSSGGLLDQPAAVIIGWIDAGNDKGAASRFNPQPYELIANALVRVGRTAKATDIRVAKIDDEISSLDYSKFHPKTWFYAAARVLTHYGYRNDRSFWAFLALIALGMAVYLFGRRGVPTRADYLRYGGNAGIAWYAFCYSVDRAVPPLRLDNAMMEYSALKPWARAYFYLHRAIGMMVLSFFIAGIAGLFK